MKKLLALAVMATSLSAGTTSAYAKSCSALWYERNQIYADYQYCFKTKRAKRAFGNDNCIPGAVNLPASAMRRVTKIKAQERRKGC